MTFSSGKNAKYVCDRCGFTYKWSSIQREPGTDFYVCRECNDGEWSRISHAQNFPPPVRPDELPLEYSNREVAVSAPTSTWTYRDSVAR